MAAQSHTEPAPEIVHLGTIDGLSCDVATTAEPWQVSIDAIVVSVGSGLGGLASSVRDRYPDAPWDTVELRHISPGHPALLRLPPGQSTDGLRLVVLASTHEGSWHGSVSLTSVASATVAAIEAAADAGATALGLPLLATGVLGMPFDDVATVVLRAMASTIGRLRTRGLRRLVFVTQNGAGASAIQQAWDAEFPTSHVRPPAEQQPTVSETELAGGIANDLVSCEGIPLIKDHLGLRPYVSMLATVIADRSTPLPLSVGIFGA